MRARMAVAVSGVTVELREIVLRDKPNEMLEASPKGTVPVLVLPDGQVVEESIDIMRWALVQSDPECWLGHEASDLIPVNDGPFKQALDRYKYPNRYGLADGIVHRDAAVAHLEMLENTLLAAPYLAGSKCGFTDIAGWFIAQPLTAVQNWLSSLVSSDLFNHIMTRYKPWKAGDAPICFP
jgi:glutathione S-transferase